MTPLLIFFLVFVVAPAFFFFLGFWVARGAPGLPFAVHIERRRYSSDAVTDWEP